MATDPLALVRTISSTAKIASAMRNAWDARTKISATLHEGSALELVIRAQIDEVLLVLAHLGEALLPLGIFNKDYYLQTLGEVQASIASCGNELLPMAWAELDAELQYVCTAGFYNMRLLCSFSSVPWIRSMCVRRLGLGPVPDMAYLEEKARRKAIRDCLWVQAEGRCAACSVCVHCIRLRDPDLTSEVDGLFDEATHSYRGSLNSSLALAESRRRKSKTTWNGLKIG